ncbi:DNA polymerase I [Sphingomonas rhizophila]|uniref:DNA polymerase I n=1 Tax=Sphingomonas rhizophila TaxID=2071607 RepID=A0A7G9SAG6_9SPHN|nr:DNA polymerase I [Sphingomonas rhizophila]QNN64841.1 DNA polymerase I [Sphingomonas rhizophila]
MAEATDKQPHLYLVDGSSYIFRAYHQLPPLTNRHGTPAGAVYGYTAMLWKLAASLEQEDGPSHLAVILDASSNTHRNQMYDQYKANRPPPPEDLVSQFPLIRVATRAFSIPCIEEEGLEADDIIACYAKAASAKGWRTTIVSSDKDLMQLIDDQVDMLDTMKDRRIGRPEVIEKFGVGPERVGDVLALMGDKVDNVPGIPGIGPKTASQLINDFGDLETVLASTDRITKPKLKQSLIDHAADARLSRQLVELVCEHPLPEPLDDLRLKGIPPEPLREFLEDQGFKTLLARMVGGTSATRNVPVQSLRNDVKPSSAAPVPSGTGRGEVERITVDRTLYQTVTTLDALDAWIAEARNQGFVALDTETDCIDCIVAKLAGISLATQPNKACYIPVGHSGADMFSAAPDQLAKADVLARLKPLLEDPAVLKIGHNLKYDLVMFAKVGIAVAPYDDTMLLSFNLDAGLGSHGMDELAKLHFEHECIAFKSVCGTGQKQITFDKVPLDAATEYAAEDADITLRLWQRLKPRVAAEHVAQVYEMVDRPLSATVARMEQRGVKVDRGYLSKLSGTFADEIAKLEAQVHEAAGGPFTIGSPQQLGQVLFERLGLKGGRKGKSGSYSTDVNELERLAGEGVDVARLVLDWRQLTKLKTTYTDALQAQINPDTGRVHTSYGLAMAQTGRLSSTDPNLQNIPIRTELGRQIRDAFVAEPGHVLMSADYSQIELRLAAHMADVPQLKEAFRAKEDIHSMTAEELFGSVDRDTRNRAKTVNFAILYGISSWGLAGRLGISREEGKAIIDRYFERFPGISSYINDTLAFAREQGFTRTLFGRKTHFPNIRSPQMNLRQGSERAAINAPIQGTSADLIKRAMNRIDAALSKAGLPDVRMLLQVHDELVFEVPKGQEERAAEVVRAVMSGAAEPAITLDVPLDVEVGWGEHWGAAH